MSGLRTIRNQQGFTIVEVVVTLVVVVLFVAGFFQSYMLLESQRVNVVRQAKASDIAYINLAKYPAKPANLDCPASGTVILGTNVNGHTAGGLYNFVAETDTAQLGATTQEIVASAPNGCDTSTNPATFKDGLVKIVSTVTYSDNRSVTHVTFVR